MASRLSPVAVSYVSSTTTQPPKSNQQDRCHTCTAKVLVANMAQLCFKTNDPDGPLWCSQQQETTHYKNNNNLPTIIKNNLASRLPPVAISYFSSTTTQLHKSNQQESCHTCTGKVLLANMAQLCFKTNDPDGPLWSTPTTRNDSQ